MTKADFEKLTIEVQNGNNQALAPLQDYQAPCIRMLCIKSANKCTADEAYDIYMSLLFSDDRTLNAGKVRGHIHYALGELYRDSYRDFSYAAAHFDTRFIDHL